MASTETTATVQRSVEDTIFTSPIMQTATEIPTVIWVKATCNRLGTLLVLLKYATSWLAVTSFNLMRLKSFISLLN